MVTRHFILILFGFLTFWSAAQYDSKGENRSRFRPGVAWHYKGIRPADSNRVHRYDRWIVDVGYNSWTGDRAAFSARPSSIGFNLNFLFDTPLTDGNTVSLGYGLQYKRTHIRHDETMSKNFDSSCVQLNEVFFGTRNSYNYNQVSVPLEIRFRKESWKNLKFHLGGTFGYAFGNEIRTVIKNSNGKITIKDQQIPDSNPLQYGVHARIGLRNLAFYGGYNLSPVFKNQRSSKLNTFMLGLSISLF